MWLSLWMSVAFSQTVEDPKALADRLIASMVAAERATQRWTFTIDRTEWVDGALAPPVRMRVHFEKPLSVYVKWIGEVDTGQELLYRKGWNEGRLRVNPPGLVPTLDLDPHGSVAMRGNRHPIDEIGFPYLIGRMAADHRLALEHASRSSVEDLGTQTVGGVAARCYRATLPKDIDPRFYAYRAEICVDPKTNLPADVAVWDKVGGQVQLVERFTFRDVHVNPRFDPLTFDPANPAYTF